MKSVKMGLRFILTMVKTLLFFILFHVLLLRTYHIQSIILSFLAFVWFTFKFLASIKELTNHMLYSCSEQTIGQQWNEMKWWIKRMLTFHFGLFLGLDFWCWPSKKSQKYSCKTMHFCGGTDFNPSSIIPFFNGILLSFTYPILTPFSYYCYSTFHFTIYLFISRALRTNIHE